MPIVPNFRDLQRAKRLATNSRLSFNSVVNNGSPASQGTAIIPPPAPVPEPVFNYVTNNDATITIANAEVPNYFIVTTTVATFSAIFDNETFKTQKDIELWIKTNNISFKTKYYNFKVDDNNIGVEIVDLLSKNNIEESPETIVDDVVDENLSKGSDNAINNN
jgi:hypothetical protein